MLSLPEPRATRQLTTFDPATGVKVIMVDPGASATVGTAVGPGYLARLWLTFPGWFWAHWEPDRLVDQAILRQVVVRIHVDGSPEPQLALPVADLVGIGLGRMANVAGRWTAAASGGFSVALPMPFQESLRIEVDNRSGDQRLDLFCNALYQQCALPAGTPYLHGFAAGGRSDGIEPITLVDVAGRGRYVGCTLACQAERRQDLGYLEAPEHVWVDDDPTDRPGIVGTGLEDYFLGGWYFREGTVTGPDHGVTIKDAFDGSVAMYRFHDHDAVVFDRSFRLGFRNPVDRSRLRPFAWSSAAFCYLQEPTPVPVPAADAIWPWYRTVSTDHQAFP